MHNKTKGKLGLLGILLYLDGGFLPRFSGYDTTNKAVVLASFILTVFTAYSIYKDITKEKKKQLKKKEAIQELVNNIKSGNIPHIQTRSIILKSSEYACSEIQTYLIETKNKIVGTSSSNSGISVRMAKGVYLRSGSGGSKKIYNDVTNQYLGNLIITNQRIVFLNDRKGFEIPYKNLTSVFSSDKNLILQSKNKSYSILISNPVIYEELIRVIAQKQLP